MIGAETVVFERAPFVVDDEGGVGPQRNWSAKTTWTVTGVSVQPLDTAEVRDLRGVEITAQWRLYTRNGQGLTVTEGDRVVWDGRTLEVVGDPQVWKAPYGGVHHYELLLREQPPTMVEATGINGAIRRAVRSVVDEVRPWSP